MITMENIHGSEGAVNPVKVENVANMLWNAQSTGVPCPAVRDVLGGDTDAAYAVQKRNTQRSIDAGRRLVGRKIGLTSKAVQKQLGVDSPDFGALFADMCFGDGDQVSLSTLIQPKAEAEVALVLDRDIAEEFPTIADVMRAVAFVVPAIEIVDSRIAAWDIRAVDTISDNASSARFVLGGTPRKLGDVDLGRCTMTMTSSGRILSEGIGRNCLGHPLNAAAWLAAKMSSVGESLRAGDIVLTGALGPMTDLRTPQLLHVSIPALGEVTCELT